jgi:hypothetical protein
MIANQHLSSLVRGRFGAVAARQAAAGVEPMFSMFETADGGPHWPSIIQAVAWLVAGAFILITIYVGSKDRFRSATRINDLQRKFLSLRTSKLLGN